MKHRLEFALVSDCGLLLRFLITGYCSQLKCIYTSSWEIGYKLCKKNCDWFAEEVSNKNSMKTNEIQHSRKNITLKIP